MNRYAFCFKTSESFSSPSDKITTALHKFPDYKSLKESEARECYELAVKQMYQSGNAFDEAKMNLLKAIELRTDYVEAYNALGDVSRYSGGNPDEAKKWYEESLYIESNNAHALLGLVYVMISAGELAEAERLKTDLEKLHPRFMKYARVERYEAGAIPNIKFFYSRRRNSHILKCMGDCYYVKGQFDEAVNRYRTAISLDSADIEVQLALGLACYRCHKYYDAEAVFQEMVRNAESLLISSSLNYRVWLCGESFFRFGEGIFTDIDNIDGPIDSAQNNLGLVYLAQSKYNEATEAFKQLGERGSSVNNLGVLLMKQQKIREAKRLLLDCDYFESKFNLAQIFESEKKWQEAADCWKSYLDGRNRLNVPKVASLYTDYLEPKWEKMARAGLERCDSHL